MGTEDKDALTKPGELSKSAYVPGDPIPTAEVIEKNTDTVWAMWSDAVTKQENTFADTVPMSLEMLEEMLKKPSK
jgi:hypothetical protein